MARSMKTRGFQSIAALLQPRQEQQGDDGARKAGLPDEEAATMDLVPVMDAGAWAEHTQAQLDSARILTRKAEEQLASNANLPPVDVKYVKNVQCQLQGKLQSTMELSHALKDQADQVHAVMGQVCVFAQRLHRAHCAKWAPLCVCERRLYLRDQRPVQELVNDHLQQALMTEKNVLTMARQNLSEKIQISKDLVPQLEDVKRELMEDLVDKRRAQRVDHQVYVESGMPGRLASTNQDWGQHRPKLSEAMDADPPFSPLDAEPGSGPRHEELRKAYTNESILKAAHLMAHAAQHMAESTELMESAQMECKKANAKTTASINKKLGELTSEKKDIEGRLLETEKMLYSVQLSLERTDRKLRQHEPPMQTLNRQFALRQSRCERENIRDPVHEKLEDHLGAVKNKVQAFTNHVDETRKLSESMRATQRALKEALHIKNLSFRVDTAVSKATSKDASVHYFQPGRRASGVWAEDSLKYAIEPSFDKEVCDLPQGHYDETVQLPRNEEGGTGHDIVSSKDIAVSSPGHSGVARMVSA